MNSKVIFGRRGLDWYGVGAIAPRRIVPIRFLFATDNEENMSMRITQNVETYDTF